MLWNEKEEYTVRIKTMFHANNDKCEEKQKSVGIELPIQERIWKLRKKINYNFMLYWKRVLSNKHKEKKEKKKKQYQRRKRKPLKT